MSIDLKALKRASEGDPSAKVAVTKAWLWEVYRLLTDRAEPSLMERIFGSEKRQ